MYLERTRRRTYFQGKVVGSFIVVFFFSLLGDEKNKKCLEMLNNKKIKSENGVKILGFVSLLIPYMFARQRTVCQLEKDKPKTLIN